MKCIEKSKKHWTLGLKDREGNERVAVEVEIS